MALPATECAARGDIIAERIFCQGAGEIARALRNLGRRPGQAICLTGGIGPHCIPYPPDDLRAAVTDREGEPPDGAIALAREFAQEIADERG